MNEGVVFKDFTYNGKTVQIGNNGYVYFNNKMLCHSDNGHGYISVMIKSKRVYVHRLVCEAYHGVCPKDKEEVNHKDGVRNNNVPQNLEWCSKSENLLHSYRELGRVNPKPGMGIKGFNHAQAKPIYQIDTNTGEILKTHGSVRSAAKLLNRDVCSILDALKGRSKTSAGFKWKYAPIELNSFKTTNQKRYNKEQLKRENKQ